MRIMSWSISIEASSRGIDAVHDNLTAVKGKSSVAQAPCPSVPTQRPADTAEGGSLIMHTRRCAATELEEYKVQCCASCAG